MVKMPEENKPASIDYLVEQGELSKEAAERLKGAWVNTADDLYSRMLTCTFSSNAGVMKKCMEKEIGLNEGKFDDFMKYIENHISSEVVNAKKPKQCPLGVRVD